MSQEDYYKKPGISQSLLKAANKGVNSYRKYLKMGERNYNLSLSDSIVIGKVVDCILTTPEDFKTLFTVAPALKFPDSVLDVISKLIEEELPFTDENILDVISRRLNYKGFGAARPHKTDTILSKFLYSEVMYLHYKNSIGKIALDEERVKISETCVYNFRNSFTRPFFESIVKSKYQVALHGNFIDNHVCKALIDQLLINDTKEPIKIGRIVLPPMTFTVVDIKTGFFLPENVIQYMYKWDVQMQLAWYTDFFNSQSELSPNLPIILYSTTQPGIEYTTYYQLSNEDLDVGRYGGYRNGRGIYSPYLNKDHRKFPLDKKGYLESFDDYLKFQQTSFTIPSKITDSEGLIPNLL